MVATCKSNENGRFLTQLGLAKLRLEGKSKMLFFSERQNYCFYYPSNTFRNTRVLKIGEYPRTFPSFSRGIWSRVAFRPIARERKYLIDYKYSYVLLR